MVFRMEPVLARYLAAAPVREFLLRREPEGSLSPSALENCFTFTYAGNKSNPKVRSPNINDSYVVHYVIDGVALGEVLSCSFDHPILPTLNSIVDPEETFSNATVVSRRFAIDLHAQNRIETLEFAWLSDLRLLASFKWTVLGTGMPFALEAETRLYPPSIPGSELTMLWDVPQVRMSLLGQVCRSCFASHISQCVCDPCVVSDRAVVEHDKASDHYGSSDCSSQPSQVSSNSTCSSQLLPRTAASWAAWCDAMRSCRPVGTLRVTYHKGIPLGPGSTRCVGELLLSDGIADYGIGCTTGPYVQEGLWRQIQVYLTGAQGLLPLAQELPLSEAEAEALLLLEYPGSQVSGDRPLHEGNSSSFVSFGDGNSTGNTWLESDQTGDENGKEFLTEWDISGDVLRSAASGLLADPGTFDEKTSVLSSFQNVPGFVQQGAGDDGNAPAKAAAGDNVLRSETKAGGRPNGGQASNTVCPQCGAKFTRPANLRRHYNTIHLKVRSKPHVCPKCDRSFFNSVELKRHMSKHEKPRLECPVCGIRFRLLTALELHVSVVHSQERPFKCECGASFARKSAHLRHVKSVHHRERYACAECDASYSQPFDLKMHKRRTGHGPDSCSADTTDHDASRDEKKEEAVLGDA